jgi:hypothetical protein
MKNAPQRATGFRLVTVPGTCPVGKVGYVTKQAAKRVLWLVNRTNLGQPMRAFRCQYCWLWHLGHRR